MQVIEYVNPEELPSLKMELATPNRNVIGSLKHAYNRKQKILLGRLHELSFTIPFYIERNQKLIINPVIKKLKSQHIVKASFNGQTDWFILSNIKKSEEDSGTKLVEVSLSSLGYQLRNKKIRTWAGVLISGEYRKESLNAQDVLVNLLEPTSWSVGYIDSDYLLKYRSFDFSNTTILDAIYQVAETFGGIIQWDSENKRIGLVKQENVGINKGLRISDSKYLKSINQEIKIDEVVTRLRLFGHDGLSIHEVNPLGTDYIEDFSYFMQGFERDANKNTISSSNFDMSDSLCHALLDYKAKVESNQGQFTTLNNDKQALEDQVTLLMNDLFVLNNDLTEVRDLIDARQKQGLDYSDLTLQEQDILSQIQTKNTDINNLETQISSINSQIATLRANIAIENNLTPDNLVELDSFIIEEIWEDTNYINAQELYDDGQKVFEDMKKPKTETTIDLVNFFNLIEGKKDWGRLAIGDKFFMYHEDFEVDVETQLIEIEIDHDENSISVTYTNTKDIERNEDKISKVLYNSISTSSIVNMSKYKWDTINKVSNDVDELINNKWDSAKREITAGKNESVVINERGITVTDPSDPNRFLRQMHGVIGMTNDGGNTFKLAITADGVVAEQLLGKITITENLFIENISGKYRFNQDGFVIDGGSLTITNGLPESQINTVSTSKWNSAEANAKSYADGLKATTDTEISNVNQSISDLNTYVDNTFKDGVISEAEANSIESYINVLNAEKGDIDSRYSVVYNDATIAGTTEQTNLLNNKNAYDTAHSNLISSINTAILDGKTTSTEKTDVDNKFSLYRTALNNLSTSFENAIGLISTKKASTAEANAKKYADDLKIAIDTDISNVNTELGNLNTYVDQSFRDSVISESEAKGIEKYSNSLNAEKAEIDSRYNVVYNDANLTGTAKTELASKKTDYNTAHTNLISSINTAIADNTATDTEITDVNSKFSLYSTALNNLSTAFENAVNNIATNKANSAEANAKSYADGLKSQINLDIADVDKRVTDLNTYIDGSFEDGVIQQSEAKSIEKYLNSLSSEKADIDNRYTSIYGNTSLSGTPKTNLLNAKTAYDTSHTDLISSINTAISDGKTTDLEKTDVDTKFSDYKAKLASLSTSFEDAVNSIAQSKADNVKDATVGKGELLNGVKLSLEKGLEINRTDNKARATFNATDGFLFEAYEGTVWNKKFYYDATSGNLVVDGVIHAKDVLVNGSSVLTADKLKLSGAKIDKISTDQLVAGTAKITTAMIESLVVGTNVTMGSGATISWSQVSNQPYIPQTASDIGALPANSSKLTYITSTGIYTGTLSADNINGGTITGVEINVNTDLTVGNSIALGGGAYSTTTTKSIRFNGYDTWIYTDGGGLKLSSFGYFTIDADLKFTKNVDLGSATSITWGNNAPSNVAYATNAGNAEKFAGYSLSSFSMSGHTHTQYASTSHSHGNDYAKTHTGQDIRLWISGNKLRVYTSSTSYQEFTATGSG